MIPRDLVCVIRCTELDLLIFQHLNLQHVLDKIMPLIGAGGVDLVEFAADAIGAGHDARRAV